MLYLEVLLLILICVQFGCSSMYTFWVVKHQSNTFFDYIVCNSMGSSTTGSSTAGSTSTYLYSLCRNFFLLYILMTWAFFYFKEKILKALRPITFSSPRAQPEVAYFLI